MPFLLLPPCSTTTTLSLNRTQISLPLPPPFIGLNIPPTVLNIIHWQSEYFTRAFIITPSSPHLQFTEDTEIIHLLDQDERIRDPRLFINVPEDIEWKEDTMYITQDIIPVKGVFSATSAGITATYGKRKHEEIDTIEEDTLRFTEFCLKESIPPEGDKLKYSKDKGWLLEQLITTKYKGTGNLLGEFQLSFLLFSVTQNYSGFEQWKILMHLVLSSDPRTYINNIFFIEFIDILQRQLVWAPDDFMNDILAHDNFIHQLLRRFYLIVSQAHQDSGLLASLRKLDMYFHTRFGQSIQSSAQDCGSELDDDEPTVVDLGDVW